MKRHRLLTIMGMAVGLSVLFSAAALAAITVGTSSTNISNDVTYTEITLDKPSGTIAGDFLLANISFKGGTSVTTITPPSGWTLLARTDNEDNVGIVSYWRVASTSDPSSWTWNFNIQTRGAGGITPFSGIDTADPIVGYASSTGRGAIATAPSTIAVANSQLVSLFAIDKGTNNSGIMSTSTGWTKLYDAKNVGMGPTVMAEHRLETVAGTTSIATTTVSNGATREWAAQQIALRPTIPTEEFWTLVVGGGGSGGGKNAAYGATGGGGGGGFLEDASTVLSAYTTYTITVGSGGTSVGTDGNGNTGENSSIGSTVVALGGGGGGANNDVGASGGSGGGGGRSSNGGTGTGGQGNNGGNSAYDTGGAGGGGASASGSNSSGNNAGNGGAGSASIISGSSVTYAGGGGGASRDNSGTEGSGGSGGGGAGEASGSGTAGTNGLGGGGGGGGTSGAGGSGIVAIRFETSAITVTDSTGASCTAVSSDTVCTWTSSGTFAFTL